jgi:predicted ATPase
VEGEKAMAIAAMSVSGYRSVRDVRLKLGQVNVLVGPNGCGKTSLYRAMGLLAAAAEGRLATTLAEEGGMPSVLWAGPRSKGPVRLTIGVELEGLAYELSAGLIPPAPLSGGSAFNLDPHIKSERLWALQGRRRFELLRRENSTVNARDHEGNRVTFPMILSDSESVLAELREPHRFPVLSAVREELRSWRFYHQFRTDPSSPLRHLQVGVRTPVLAADGRDLAAALRTILEVGDGPALGKAIDRAFPGSTLLIEAEGGRFSLALQTPEIIRPFAARELSDGTLHYLCLLAALLSPRPPSLLALNEPEASIHPDLIDPLAALVARASRDCQIWITTHSERLAQAISHSSGTSPIVLKKVAGATRIVGREDLEVEEHPAE